MRAVSVSPLPMGNKKRAPKPTIGLKKHSKGRKIPIREDHSDDGYEDLIKGDESKFNMKVNSLKVSSSQNDANDSVIFLPHRDYFTPLI